MTEKDKHPEITQIINNVIKDLEGEVLIGFKGNDRIAFDYLREIVSNRKLKYKEIKEEKFNYSSSEPNRNKEKIYQNIYHEFIAEFYEIITQKAIEKRAEIVLLDDKKYNGELYIKAYYYINTRK